MARELERGARDAGRGKTSPARANPENPDAQGAGDFLTDLAAQQAHERDNAGSGERDH
jgi:hypothetical protein